MDYPGGVGAYECLGTRNDKPVRETILILSVPCKQKNIISCASRTDMKGVWEGLPALQCLLLRWQVYWMLPICDSRLRSVCSRLYEAAYFKAQWKSLSQCKLLIPSVWINQTPGGQVLQIRLLEHTLSHSASVVSGNGDLAESSLKFYSRSIESTQILTVDTKQRDSTPKLNGSDKRFSFYCQL